MTKPPVPPATTRPATVPRKPSRLRRRVLQKPDGRYLILYTKAEP